MSVRSYRLPSHRTPFLALLLALLCFAALTLGTSGASAAQTVWDETPEVAAFRQSVGGSITPVLVELKRAPAVVHRVTAEQAGETVSLDNVKSYMLDLHAEQETLLASLERSGVRAMLRELDVPQIDGSVRHVEYRFTYVLNGFVAYVATPDIARLRALPEVEHVSEFEPVSYHLDKAIDYSLGTQTNIADRRLAVYGPTEELGPAPVAGHPEQPDLVRDDGYEGQGMYIAIIDSGVDWRHPMFGGIGNTTPLPRVSGQPESPQDNRKVVYYYALSSPGDITDDFGHGTLVASTAAGYVVDGNTVPRPGYGLGRDGTGIGPTPNNARLHGTAPQARILAYKVCGPAPQCPGDIPLAIEDAASPFTLVEQGVPTPFPKPVADVINLSLGSTVGDPASATSRAVNNAALAGSIVVASAGNSGPGAATVGAPGVATLSIAVAASLDPGSTPSGDVLAADQVPTDPRVDNTPGPEEERGVESEANAINPTERQGIVLFPVAGGGAVPEGSISAHYVFVDRSMSTTDPVAEPVPSEVTNRIALVQFGGDVPQTFAQVANVVAASNPAAILLITDIESATAVQVINGIPTYTINTADADYLLDILPRPAPDAEPAVGTISQFPLRISEGTLLEAFQGRMAGFSSRGPNEEGTTLFPVVKPDVTAPGVGILGAATPEGTPSETVGLADLTGYVQANGTSFSGPITAGAMVLIRQFIRENLGLDSVDPADRERRFDTVTVARAMLMNSATNLRNGFGQPQGDGEESVASINDMGAGHINVSGALEANAIMVAPTILHDTAPNEFNPPAGEPAGDMEVLIPSVSFGAVPVVNSGELRIDTHEVRIRDITAMLQPLGFDQGSGTYGLTFQNNRNVTDPQVFSVSFTSDEAGTTDVTSVNVPPAGEASFYVRVIANGAAITESGTEFQWYVTATNLATGQQLRMPFFYRAVTGAPTSVTVGEVTAASASTGWWSGLALLGLAASGTLAGLHWRRRKA